MNKKVKNKVRNKGLKQAEAREKLEAASRQGPVHLACVLFTGNSYMRQVVRGIHLAPGVAKYELTETEALAMHAMEAAFDNVRGVKHGKDSDPDDALVVYKRARAYLEGEDIWVSP